MNERDLNLERMREAVLKLQVLGGHLKSGQSGSQARYKLIGPSAIHLGLLDLPAPIRDVFQRICSALRTQTLFQESQTSVKDPKSIICPQ
jgi:hypothetical protein